MRWRRQCRTGITGRASRRPARGQPPLAGSRAGLKTGASGAFGRGADARRALAGSEAFAARAAGSCGAGSNCGRSARASAPVTEINARSTCLITSSLTEAWRPARSAVSNQ